MPLTDAKLLRAVQTAPTRELRDDFETRFRPILYRAAADQCNLRGIHQTEINDVVQDAIGLILNPKIKRFDLRGENAVAYVWGQVQNAAKSYARFLREGDAVRHNWGDERNADRGLPQRIEDVAARMIDPVIADLAAAAMDEADNDEAILIGRHFFDEDTLEAIAIDLGVDRSTVSRRLRRFCQRVRKILLASA
jgi:RNA polymerase sigma factor (sigma-70 family)